MAKLLTLVAILTTLLLMTSSSAGAAESKKTHVEASLNFIQGTASFPLEMERCSASLADLVETAHQGATAWVRMHEMRQEGCLDKYSSITRTVKAEQPCAPITSYVKDGTLVVRLPNFCGNTSRSLLQEVRKYLVLPAKMILDLRDNGGGDLDGAISTAGLFAPAKGAPIVTLFHRDGRTIYRTESRGPLADVWVSVVVNDSTASAAELLIGALQFWRRHHFDIVGTQTYGKGSYQRLFEVGDVRLAITAGEFRAGAASRAVSIEGIGIAPTIVFTAKWDRRRDAADTALELARDVLGQ